MDKARMTELAEKASKGSREAFSELYAECREPLKKYIIKQGASADEAEDVVSAAFVKAMESIADLREPAYFDTWLHTIAKNEFTASRRRENRAVRIDFGGAEDDNTNESVDMAAFYGAEEDTLLLPEDYAENEDVKRVIAGAVNSLSDEQRDTVFLYYYNELSVGQIAEQMNVPAGTVKSRLSSARSALKKHLEQLQKQGVALCIVPIGSILAFAENNSGKAAAAAAATSAASGKMIAAAVMAVVVGTTGTLIYFNGRNNRLKGDDRPTDSLIVESIDDSSRDMTSTESTSESFYEPDSSLAVKQQRIESLPKSEPSRYYSMFNTQGDFITRSTWQITDDNWALIEQFASEHFTDDMNDYQKMLTAFYYIAENTEYDQEYTSELGTYGVLVQHLAQSNGFSMCFAEILRYLGYDANVVLGYRENDEFQMQHFWCTVENGDKTYVFDPTIASELPTEKDMEKYFCIEYSEDRHYIVNNSQQKEIIDGFQSEDEIIKSYLIINDPLSPDQLIEADIERDLIDKFAKEHFTNDMTTYQKALTAYEYIINETDLTDEITQADGSYVPVSQVLEKHEGNSFALSACMASFLCYLGLDADVIYGEVVMPNGETKTHYCCYANNSLDCMVFDPFLEKVTNVKNNKYFCYYYSGYDLDTEDTRYTGIKQYLLS